MMSRLLAFLGLVALAQGFLVGPLASPPGHATRTPAISMGIVEDAAANCLEEGCSVDTIEDLIAELEAEAKTAKGNRAIDLKSTVTNLRMLIGSPLENKSEIEKLVASAARSFSVVGGFGFPGEPLGYSGEVGTTTTAGEALE
jgi:hypothetical protein